MNLQESIRRILREENEGHKVKLVIRMIYSLYDEVSFIEQSTYNNKPLLKIYFDSDDTAANIESWFDTKITKDIDKWTSGNIVVCPTWMAEWDVRKEDADVFIETELLKYDNLGNVINESVLREETDLYSNLKTVAFKDLPFEYQRSLIIYMYEGDVVDWSLDLDRDVVAKNDDLIKTLIKDYISVGRNKNKSFAYGLVPMKELTKEIAERMGYDSFKDYHKDYTSDNYTPRYKKESVWPIILDVDNEELIEDGWHRFHQYYKMGLNKVPAVMLM